MKLSIIALVFYITGCSLGYSKDTSTVDTKIIRDLQAYAMASCYTYLSDPYLSDQGDAAASVVIQRSNLHPNDLSALISAVKDYSIKNKQPTMRSENLTAAEKELPVLFCSEVIFDEKVNTEIDRLTGK